VQQEGDSSDAQEDGDTSGTVESSSITAAESTSRVLDEESIMKELYPDMSVWQNDFAHHMADRMVEQYYESPAFDDFPVVGITWDAAKHFAAWRTEYLNAYREKRDLWAMPQFRLPTAAEWTYAARGGKAKRPQCASVAAGHDPRFMLMGHGSTPLALR
jgi:formylglycine-generating enzyme required for sulfatase activity